MRVVEEYVAASLPWRKLADELLEREQEAIHELMVRFYVASGCRGGARLELLVVETGALPVEDLRHVMLPLRGGAGKGGQGAREGRRLTCRVYTPIPHVGGPTDGHSLSRCLFTPCLGQALVEPECDPRDRRDIVLGSRPTRNGRQNFTTFGDKV